MRHLLRLIWIHLLFSGFRLQAGELRIPVKLFYGEQELNLKEGAIKSKDGKFTFHKIKFYLATSNELQGGHSDSYQFFLIDAADEESCFLTLSKEFLEGQDLKFDLGIDSIIQYAGVQGGALDPRKGMYWAWNSGYIFFKLEADCYSEKFKHSGKWHLGGFRAPYIAKTTFQIKKLRDKSVLVLDLKPFLEYCVSHSIYEVMSPGPQAVELTHLLSTLIQCKPN